MLSLLLLLLQMVTSSVHAASLSPDRSLDTCKAWGASLVGGGCLAKLHEPTCMSLTGPFTVYMLSNHQLGLSLAAG